MFIACDGPNCNRPGEAERAAATLALVETAIDLPYEVHRGQWPNGNLGSLSS